MATLTERGRERRRMPRLAPESTGWRELAVLRPGVSVRVVNIGPLGALLESHRRLRPGLKAELQLTATHNERRLIVCGRLGRCHVSGLEPLRYRGAVEFDRIIELTEVLCG
jgi:hypothetical protein